MENLENEIEAKDKSLGQILERQHFVIDEYQRAYCWKRKQIETLLDDLYYNFSDNLSDPEKNDVKSFDSYYMGPIVVSKTKTSKSIVDGQQRLTTFTLLLIYLYHLCEELGVDCDIDILSRIRYKRGYVIDVPERQDIMNILLDGHLDESFDLIKTHDNIDDSIPNIINAYQQISEDFPVELRSQDTLLMFIEWLFDNVILVEIVAYSNEKAYTIFETMNDRGLTLTPTEILKAHILSQVDEEKKTELNKLWHKKINLIIQQAGDNGDADFFKAWFRAKYAETIRSSSSNKKKEDFESIGAHYHTWFKNTRKFNLHNSQDYYFFLKGDFDFFTDQYIKIKQHQWSECQDALKDVYVTSCYPMADSLYLPLLMSPLSTQDTNEEIEQKIRLVNKFVDDFNNLKTLAYQSIAQTAVRNTINNLVLQIRNNSIPTLSQLIENEKTDLLRIDPVPFDNFVPGLYYAHYFLARLRLFHDNEIPFSSLLRTKRQSSYIAVPIARYNEVEQYNRDHLVSLNHNILLNYCLIRRYEQNEYNQLPLSERIVWLKEKGYLPEFGDEYVEATSLLSFWESRKRKFTEFVAKTWGAYSTYE